MDTTTDFIEQVHSAEAVWNISIAEFRDTERKDQLWTKIGQKYGITGEEAKRKFVQLREKYRRQKKKEEEGCKSGTEGRKKPPWKYLTNLEFLDECYKRRRAYDSDSWSSTRIKQEPEIEFKEINSPSPSCSTQSDALEDVMSPRQSTIKENPLDLVFMEQTDNLIQNLKDIANTRNATKPYGEFCEFLRKTMEDLPADKGNKMERELMDVLYKYKYK